jgi:protocatechuate 3,4-dioxygenase beta subunit
MNRRDFLVTVSAASAAMALLPVSAEAQDWEYLRALERAQRERPSALAWRARIAPAGEPGTPMVIHGRLFKGDGRTPAPGICVFAYHTDRTGIYAEPSRGPHVWRLRGWTETDASGRFQFDSIRPAAYPGRSTPEHVHLTLEGPGLPRVSADEVFFEDDKLLSAAQREQSAKNGIFGAVRKVEIRDGVHHVTVNLKLA